MFNISSETPYFDIGSLNDLDFADEEERRVVEEENAKKVKQVFYEWESESEEEELELDEIYDPGLLEFKKKRGYVLFVYFLFVFSRTHEANRN